jgi:hypothetical protein
MRGARAAGTEEEHVTEASRQTPGVADGANPSTVDDLIEQGNQQPGVKEALAAWARVQEHAPAPTMITGTKLRNATGANS